ncbi:tripartite motif-containing protein 2-like [Mytilus edulis]|uniref:tripartite motif-containing protein 2-like n=1 Tax=Mytilus edulis TaxID=6550 RepID=UPI0039EEF09D
MASADKRYLLKCNICLDTLLSPRALPCLHSFCEECLKKHIHTVKVSEGTSKVKIPCPTCRTQTLIPKDGVRGFPKDFRINQLNDILSATEQEQKTQKFTCELCEMIALATKYCSECKKYFCNTCSVKHCMSKVLNSHILSDVFNRDENIGVCEKHKNEPIKFFCQSCDFGICLHCVLGDHEQHLISSLDDVNVDQREELTICLKHVENQISFLKDQIFNITSLEGNQRSSYVNEICSHRTKQLRLNKTQLCHPQTKQHQSLQKEKDRCHMYLQQFETIQNNLQNIIRNGNSQFLNNSHSQILHEILNINVTIETIMPGHDFKAVTHNNGRHGHFQDSKLEVSYSSKHNYFPPKVHIPGANNSLQSSFVRGNNSLQSPFVRGHNSSYICRVKPKYQSSFADQNPLNRCINRLSALSLPRQPYDPAKYQNEKTKKVKFLFKIGGYGQTPGCLNLPFGISFLKNDILVVAENGSGRIQKFDSFGKSLECIQLKTGYPRCITTGRDNEIYITDESNKCVKLISKDKETIITRSIDSLHFPYGIVALDNGTLAVSDMIYERLSIIKPSGEIVSQFGCYGNNNSSLNNPSYLETDGENIFVSDSGHHQIKMFNKHGKFLQKLGDFGSNIGEMKYPKGIAITRKGEIIVADAGNNRVVMFSKTGDTVTTLLDINDIIDRPIDVACTPSGLMAVAITDRHEVYVYKLY